MLGAIIALSAVLYWIYTHIYHLRLSPLARIPGPTISALTRVRLAYNELKGKRRVYVHGLHEKYGPVVRIAPDEVSFTTADALKEIYNSGGAGYDKTEFYSLFANFGARNTFSTLQKTEHAEVKKRIADRYTKTYIMQTPILNEIRERADAFVAKVSEFGSNGADIYVHLHCYSLDCITHHLFHPFGTYSVEDPEDLKKMQELSYQDSVRDQYLRYYFPIFSEVLAKFTTSRRNKGIVSNYVLNSAAKTEFADFSVASKLRGHKKSDPEQQTVEIASECMDHILAGIDTTGDGLCFLVYQLSLPESQPVQEKLRSELLTSTRDLAALDALPYLDAVIKEGLRCWAPIPMSLPRYVPEGGRVINGYYLPAGTIVSAQAWSVHRLNADVFPDPDAFLPERWLASEGAVERNRFFWPFSSGGRGCIGKNIALMEMKILLKEVYSTFRTVVHPDMKANMEVSDQVMSARPKDQTCRILFQKLA